MKLYAMELSKI